MKKLKIVLFCLLLIQVVSAQNKGIPITTAVPFLQVTPDARAGAMGDQGVATSADTYSQFWNPSKYNFHTSSQGFSVNYTPYLTALVDDVSLGQLTYFNRMSDKQAFSVGFRYFSLGEIEFRKNISDPVVIAKPNELALDLAYSLKLSDHFAMAIAARYIRSNLKLSQVDPDATSANGFAVDISGFYNSKEFAISDFVGKYRLGYNIQNVGPKLKYKADDVVSFLPTNLKAGAGFDFILDQHNTISINTEINKLLVPTPKDFNGDGVIDKQDNDEYNKIAWSEGVFKSFGDAPGGSKEELQEVIWSLGAEYWYQEAFALRAGYFHESQVKGFRKYYTVGAGFKYNVVQVDLSYIFSTSKIPNPLEGTLRFSLAFNFDQTFSSKSASNN